MPATEKKARRRTSQTGTQPTVPQNAIPLPPLVVAKADRKPPRPKKWPSQHSKARQQATLQSSADAASDRLQVTYQSGRTVLGLFVEGQEILQGAWEATITADGRSLPINIPWELNLWHACEECDYLELTCLLAEGLRVDRQILLSRTERFAVLADAVGHAKADGIEYAAHWSLAKKVTVESPDRSPERRLRQGRRAMARVFPVGIAQGPGASVNSTNSKHLTNGDATGLTLRQTTEGTALFAPLVIDWHPERRNEQATWRALTVTEEEVVVRPDRASGYRIRVGDYQLLLYRSLQATPDTRCLLGYHTRFETAIGQFLASGTVNQIMATVPDDE